MSTIFSSILPRRGRKKAYETQLDSIWGDAKITSPTDTAKPWSAPQPKTGIDVTEVDLSDGSDGATIIDDLSSANTTPTEIPPRPNLRANSTDKTVSKDSTSTMPFLPSPRDSPMPSPNQFILQPSYDYDTVVITNSEPRPGTLRKKSSDHANALGLYGVSPPMASTVSPPSTSDVVYFDPQVPSPPLSAHTDVTRMYFPSRRPLSPPEISALARRTKRIDSPVQETSPVMVASPFVSLNAAASEILPSSVSTIIGAEPTANEADQHTSEEDGIIVVDTSAEETLPALSELDKPAPSKANSLQETSEIPVTATSNAAILTEQPRSSDKSSLSVRFDLAPSETAPRLSNENDATVVQVPRPDHEALADSTIYMDTGIACDVPGMGSVLPSRSPFRPSTAQSCTSSIVSSDSTRIRSPPLGVTGMMRMRSPPLGSCDRMRMQAQPTSSEPSWPLHSHESQLSSVNHTVGQPVDHLPRQRSASVATSRDPPPSEHEIPPSLHQVVGTGLGLHRRLQSDQTVPNQIVVDEFAARSISPIGYAVVPIWSPEHICHDPSVFSKRSRNQVALESPPLYKRVAVSDSPMVGADPVQREPTGKGFYDEVKNDYRMVSREVRAVQVINTPAQKDISSNSGAQTDRRRQQSRARSLSRARSASRARERSGTRQPKQDVIKPNKDQKYTKDEKTLVPSYAELWD